MTQFTAARSATRRVLAITTGLAVAASGAVLSAASATAAPPAASSPAFEDGRYVVVLAEDPLATYDGGIQGLRKTAPADGADLDADSPEATAYRQHLDNRQNDIASSVGATVESHLTAAVNGFVANLTAEQAQKLSAKSGVRAVAKNEILKTTASPANEALQLPALWERVGGVGEAGDGVVVGVLDTGIAPENPLFAGEPLGTAPSDEPYWNGDSISYAKSDGQVFNGVCQTGPGFEKSDCSTKIVGARYYVDGFGADRIGNPEQVPGEYASPRDGDGHGSHTASTAAGNADVPVTTVGGNDLGTMSGVAPEAKISAYKVCWSGPDPVGTDDDGCASTDLVEAIDQSVIDGVDVINFSIGGGAATAVTDVTDIAFLGAAAAGVFVSASAGNSGPGDSTVDHASPWYSTVAASSVRNNFEATLRTASGATIPGGSITVPTDGEVSGEFVAGSAIPAAGQTADSSGLCMPDSLDPEAAAGKIVLCERGGNARINKSEVAAAAGAIGVVLVNPTPNSIDLDDHVIPTVHFDAQYYEQLIAAAAAGQVVTLLPGNQSGIETVAPVVAGFSSRGPALADGSDVIKPDMSAPGVGILAASYQAPGGPDRFGAKSGTSMAAPHVAGLAAVYLSERPTASPSEVKSALMTSAKNTLKADGSTETSPFAQGAGVVQSPSFVDPGFIYDSGTEDWYGYLRGLGYTLPESWVGEKIDPSDLNLPSIGIGALAGSQTVTRTATALEPGSYAVSVEGVAGVNVSVSPQVLEFTEAGQEISYEVTFSNAGAAVNEWATGSLTWTSENRAVRSPVAVKPIALDVPEWVNGERRTGNLTFQGVAGVDGRLRTTVNGYAPYNRLGAARSGEGEERSYDFEVKPNTLAQDLVLQGNDDVADLDLLVERLDADGNTVEQWVAATEAASESLLLEDPEPGKYRATVQAYSLVEGTYATRFTLEHAAVRKNSAQGDLSVKWSSQQVKAGDTFDVTVRWRKLKAGEQYLGIVTSRLGGTSERTYIYTDSGAGAPQRP